MQKENISFNDFLKIDIRVGEVKKCETVEKSNKLLRLHIDFGTEIGSRIILTGLAKFYQPADLENKKFLFLINLAPKEILGEMSSGMLLVANVAEKPTLFSIDSSLPNGCLLY